MDEFLRNSLETTMSDHRRHTPTGVPIVPLWLRAVLVLATFGVLIYYSIVPAPGSGSITYGPLGMIPYSMWLHFLGYMGLAIVLSYASATVRRPQSQILLGVFVVTVGCGIAVEVLQLTLPTRTFSVLDMAINALGAGVGVTLWYLFDRLVARVRAGSNRSDGRERL